MSNWPYEDPIEDEEYGALELSEAACKRELSPDPDAVYDVIEYLNGKLAFTPEMGKAIDSIFNHLERTGH